MWASLALAQQPFTVGRVEVVGSANVPTAEILAAVGFKAGDTVDAARVRAAVQAISGLGYFASVTPELAVEGDIVVVRFRVVEFPKIERITIEGVPPAPKGSGTLWSWIQAALASPPRPSESRIREILKEHGIKPGQVLNQVKLEGALKAVLEEYRKKDLATVQIGRIIPGAELVIEIQELPVLGHRFRGLVTVPEEEARALVSVPVGALGKISDIQATLTRLGRAVYFAQAGVVPELGDGGVWLTWEVTERTVLAEPASVRGIELLGVTAFPLDRLTGRIAPLPTGPATNYDVLRALAGVNEYYRREGYFMVEFVGEGIAGGILRVRVKEGRIQRIEVGGSPRTAEWVIRRVMDLAEGQLLTEARYTAARQALMALGYFSDVRLEPSWTDEGLLLTVTVTEQEKLGSIQGTMTYSPQEKGLVGNLSYAQKNLFGTAQDVSVSLAQGLGEAGSTTWSLGYRAHSFPVYDLVGLDLYRKATGKDPTTVTLGGSATLSYPMAPYLDLTLTLTSERAWEVPDEKALDPRTAVEVGLAYDDRDSPFFPRTGNRGRLAVEQAGLFAPGVEYLSLRAELSRFWPVDIVAPFWDGRAALAGRVLVRWGVGLPERFWFDLGGVDSVRGARGVRTDRLALLNTELRFELVQGAFLALFWDLGADLTQLGRVKSSIGLEIAAYVAGMFVRIDMAWPSDRPFSWVPAFEFGMSPMF
ncbi:MAG: BamA/TamA family outer membrane protein [Candidatus Acetothermia bacterium]|jgi:outer membrane protein insertion porin family|nr:BamA/TamA family outer membrane protein [Candidatus Acetothermia bacterium]